MTFYRIIACKERFSISGADETGKPYSWEPKRQGRLYTKADAELVAQKLAEYLLAYPTAGLEVAKTVRIVPATGGMETGWRPRLLHLVVKAMA